MDRTDKRLLKSLGKIIWVLLGLNGVLEGNLTWMGFLKYLVVSQAALCVLPVMYNHALLWINGIADIIQRRRRK